MKLERSKSFYVLDFDPTKVEKMSLSGREIIRKRTFQEEANNLRQANLYLQKSPMMLGKNVKVRAAEILDWDEDYLYLEYCKGMNLEHIIRFGNSAEKKFCLRLLADFVGECRERGFLWGDFAPRNMVYNEKMNLVLIFDFEKKLDIRDCSQQNIEFSDFFRGYSFEELSCLLDSKSQEFVFNGIIFDRLDDLICAKEINSLRKRRLLDFYFGAKKEYLSYEVQHIEDLMSFVETPFNVEGLSFFPIDILESLKKIGGYDEYAKIVGRLARYCSRYERLGFLRESFRRLCFDEIQRQ